MQRLAGCGFNCGYPLNNNFFLDFLVKTFILIKYYQNVNFTINCIKAKLRKIALKAIKQAWQPAVFMICFNLILINIQVPVW